ncbi:MAG: pyridoxamine 5'-phosphate oxidase family protein [Patescibacteria group bacterium]|nr:pyridoxamine 5'-phosphate oxidase family protein [Patescibacteria group bacterium]
MKLSEYFEQAKGVGVLATTDAAGQVNQALYAKPHFLDEDDEGTCSFIMANRLTHDNVGHNPSAAYLFMEDGDGYAGKRLSLTVIGEETDAEKIKAFRRRKAPPISEGDRKYLVHFHIDGVRPLIGVE